MTYGDIVAVLEAWRFTVLAACTRILKLEKSIN